MMGIRSSIIIGEDYQGGTYYTYSSGRSPQWNTVGDFRWKLSIEHLKDALEYISSHPLAKDSIIKSKVILSILFENESKLCGTVYIGGSTPNLTNEPCDLVKVLKGERTTKWNGKWLYTDNLELVSHKEISKQELNSDIYGCVKQDSKIYNLLGFKKTDIDEVEELKRKVPMDQLNAFFENELRTRFGITSSDLSNHFDQRNSGFIEEAFETSMPEFPIARVKSWESLKKHSAEMLCFANPVKYDYVIRRIRVSNRRKEARAYLFSMYKYDGSYKYACQMCHDSCSNIEAVQLFNEPETELDPMNISLCPNCAAIYRDIRNNSSTMELFQEEILKLSETEITSQDTISLSLDGEDLWFTQIHIAEIQTLLVLKKQANQQQLTNPIINQELEDGDENALSVYSSYVGKTISRKDGFLGKITKVDGEYVTIDIQKGQKAGSQTKIQLAFILNNPNVYTIV